jgi:vitellogenic carboxypeptidase-like protein
VWIEKLEWPGRKDYLAAPRLPWILSSDKSTLAGWVQTYSNLTELVINGAGHLAPMDQPERLADMITTFVEGSQFLTKK